MAKKTAASKPRAAGAARMTVAAKNPRAADANRVTKSARKTSAAPRGAKKHVGDVLGISRATAKKPLPSRGGRPKGIELTPRRRSGLKPARVVGGVRGRGR